MNAQVKSVEMPPGKYWVGDPCYAVPNGLWMEWLEAADYTNPERRLLLAEVEGHTALGIGTAHGDGCYLGSDGNEYPVDAGLLGVVPEALAAEKPSGMELVEFDAPFDCEYDSGVIVIGHVRIDTDPDENY